VAEHHSISGCPHLGNDLQAIRDRYEAYVHAQANPFAQGCPEPFHLPGLLQAALPARFDDPAAYLSFIGEMRHKSGLSLCPMCGLPGAGGTIDHIFPQVNFPDLAIFSRNLVPSCHRCNSNHQDHYRGQIVGERLLHPYFDGILESRLVQAIIQPNPDFRLPAISLEPYVDANDPVHRTIKFHIETVLKPAGIMKEINVFWAALQRMPRSKFPRLPLGNFSDQDFITTITAARDMADEWLTSPNNYESMIFEALRVNIPARQYLAQWIKAIDEDRRIAEDV